MTTNADLIAEARDTHDRGWEVAAYRMLPRLADALEAAEAQVARLTAIAKAAITHLDGTTISGDLRRALANRDYPADLRAAVRHVAECDLRRGEPPCERCGEAVATLRRYGLIEEEARS